MVRFYFYVLVMVFLYTNVLLNKYYESYEGKHRESAQSTVSTEHAKQLEYSKIPKDSFCQLKAS